MSILCSENVATQLIPCACRRQLENIHANLEQLVDSPESLPEWNVTLTITYAFFNFGELTVTPYLINTHPTQVTVPWDADLASKATVAHHIPAGTPLSPAQPDSKFMSKFPTPEFGPFTKPTTVVDCLGQILIWFLPDILDSTANVGCT